MRGSKVLESNGQNEARAYGTADVPATRPEPPVDPERVRIVDPQELDTTPSGPPSTSAPRNPHQKVWPPPPPPGVDLPDALPATKAQRVLLDPELVARWREEAKMKETA